jgi:hypothetical protein
MKFTLLFVPAILSTALASCASPPAANDDAGVRADVNVDTPVDAPVATHAVAVRVAFAPDEDGMNVSLRTQNGSFARVPVGAFVGRLIYWQMLPGGEPAGNAPPIEVGRAMIGADLTANIAPRMRYADGFYELACVVSLSGTSPTMGVPPGDLAAFDLDPPPEGEPPLTGVSVRVRVTGADASVTLVNRHFIRLGSP